MELLGGSQATFGDMITELGLSTEMRADAEYTLLAPFNAAFTGESHTACCTMYGISLLQFLKV